MKWALSSRCAMPCATSSFRPRFNTVSIMPGMENFAPERLETSNGFCGSPNLFSVAVSTVSSAAVACSHSPSGSCWFACR